MGNHHGEDEDEEEAVVCPADAPVEEKAVVVIVFDAHVAQLAMFSVVWKKQLCNNQRQSGKESYISMNKTF